MKIDLSPRLDDPIPMNLFEAHEIGAVVNSMGKMPCSICRAVYESGQDIILRDHFHGSDFGACKRKVFNVMKTGIKGTSQSHVFLADGHLHEASMLSNLIAGLDGTWAIKAMANQSEKILEVLGFNVIGHVDALLINSGLNFEDIYLIECKSVKDYTFKKVKGGEISDEWYGQMQVYLMLMEIDRGYLIVKHRETSKILPPIRIDRDNTFISKRLNALSEIHNKIISGMEQPEREHKTSKDSECLFCPFKSSCWGMKETEEEEE